MANEQITMPQYKRPPITEAVIEIRFEQPLPKKLVNAVHTKLKKSYEYTKPVSKIDISYDIPRREAKLDSEDKGYQLSNGDQTDVLQINPTSIAFSRLAPYDGWELFRNRAESNWKILKRVTGHQKISRLGVRYINRIDIPATGKEKIRIEDYLTIYPEYAEPGLMVAMTDYTMQIIGPLKEGNVKLIINSRAVRSPLEEHVSVLLDIDVVREVDVPQKDAEIWKEFDLMRIHKNRIFEECVTDSARKLFEL